MIEGLMQIGNAIAGGKGSLSNFINNVEPKKGNKQLNVFKINFDLEEGKLEFDVLEEMDENSSEKYNFIGRSGGPNSPQWFATSTHITYHISETIYNLSNRDFGDRINMNIRKILENFYYGFSEDFSNKYKHALDIEKFNISDKSMETICKEAIKAKENLNDAGKEIISTVNKYIDNHLKNKYDMRLNDFGLFTISINGVPLANEQDYIDEVLNFKESDIKFLKEGSCSLCQTTKELTMDINLGIKFYTTNQIIFASGLEKKNYSKNMIMCKTCLSKYLAAENYIKNNLASKLGVFYVYIIPQFVYGVPLNNKDLNYVSESIISSFNTIKSFNSIEKMRDTIIDITEDYEEDTYFLLNFIFYTSSQQSTKVQAHIKDINPSIFEKIRKASIDVYDNLGKHFYHYINGIDLNTVYYMNPIMISRGSPTQFRSILQIYESILLQRKINKKSVIKNINECINIIRLEKVGFNINPKDSSIEFHVIRANMYIRFLELLGVVERRQAMAMDVNSLNVKDDLKEFIKEMGYNEQESSMYLLGTLIGSIGNSQYTRSTEGNKPILNKLNFNGIEKSKLVRLIKDVFNKLNQEKILSYNEMIFFEMKRLVDKNLDNWKLDKDENLFYILSGYSYVTARSILNKRRNKDVE